jgi:hypothetical protein
VLERDAWANWLDPSILAKLLTKPLGAGKLAVERSNPTSSRPLGKVEEMVGAVQRLPVPRSSEYPAFRRAH